MYSSFENTWAGWVSLSISPFLPCEGIEPSQRPPFWPDEQQAQTSKSNHHQDRRFVPAEIHVQPSSAIITDQGMVGQRANAKCRGKACFIWRRWSCTLGSQAICEVQKDSKKRHMLPVMMQ